MSSRIRPVGSNWLDPTSWIQLVRSDWLDPTGAIRLVGHGAGPSQSPTGQTCVQVSFGEREEPS